MMMMMMMIRGWVRYVRVSILLSNERYNMFVARSPLYILLPVWAVLPNRDLSRFKL